MNSNLPNRTKEPTAELYKRDFGLSENLHVRSPHLRSNDENLGNLSGIHDQLWLCLAEAVVSKVIY